MAGSTLRVVPLAVAAALLGASAMHAQSLTGAGATFPNPIYQKWFSEYNKATGVQVNYQSVGSGAGIQQYTQKTVDFGATDGPMTAEQLTAVQGAVLHLPTVLGAVVITYNVPEAGATQLKLDGATIADIFLGKITRWNDPRITAANPGVRLPATDVVVVHRAESSGTSFVFTDFLSKVSPEWKTKVGGATAVNWPVGLGGRGNEGVTEQVKQVPGSIGYVELVYAIQQKLPYAQIKNAAGAFVTPSLESTTAAAASARFEANTDFRVSITNAPGAASYPIASFTWLLVRPDMTDPVKAKALKSFLEWMITPAAQDMAKALSYAPLPKEVAALVAERIKTLKANGRPIGG